MQVKAASFPNCHSLKWWGNYPLAIWHSYGKSAFTQAKPQTTWAIYAIKKKTLSLPDDISQKKTKNIPWCPMMSHYIPLNPRIVMVATRRSPPWDELCRLEPFSGWIFDSPETMERYEKNMATFLMVSYQWFISMECWWFIYIYIIWDVIWEH